MSSSSGDSENAHLPPANLTCNKMKPRPKTGTEYRNSNRLEVLHLFRWFTHTPRCRGAFLEDAQLDTDQIDQNANSAQMIASNEERSMIYVLLPSGISDDAAPCWARTFSKITRCPARWARPSWLRDSELKVAGLAKPVMPCSRPIKWNRCLQGPGAKYCVIARWAG